MEGRKGDTSTTVHGAPCERSPELGDDPSSESPQHTHTTLLEDVWGVLTRRLSFVEELWTMGVVEDLWTMGMSISFNDLNMELEAGDEDFIGNRCMFYVV